MSRHHLLQAIGLRRRRFGDKFGSAAGGGLIGGDGVPPGRKLAAGELQLVLLALLAEQPAHGYELIRILEERSGGFYTPSAGMIYPALTYIGEIGHATASQDGNRKLHSITEAGRAHLTVNKDQAEMILLALARIGGRMADVREAFAGLQDADPVTADDLHQARRAFKQALMSMRGCGPDEARRIAKILHCATAEILKKPGQS